MDSACRLRRDHRSTPHSVQATSRLKAFANGQVARASAAEGHSGPLSGLGACLGGMGSGEGRIAAGDVLGLFWAYRGSQKLLPLDFWHAVAPLA